MEFFSYLTDYRRPLLHLLEVIITAIIICSLHNRLLNFPNTGLGRNAGRASRWELDRRLVKQEK